jgi:uncharacterized protein with gpF-like domain
MIPKEALAYLKDKSLKPAFSYKDVWHEEHATAFTVAKAVQLDVMTDLRGAIVDAMEKGQSFESFKKNIKPVLQQKGWRGKKENDRSPDRENDQRPAWQRPPPQDYLPSKHEERLSKRPV